MKTNVLIFLALVLAGCNMSAESSFKKTQAGSALYSCVSGSGQLNVSSIGKNLVEANLIKNEKDIRMQFSLDPSMNQAKLEGAVVKGENDLTKFSLMLTLELVCSGEIAAKIFPDEYNALRLMNSFR